MHISMKNVHPCDFKPIQHILSVHSNVTAVTTMCFIGGIAFMTVVDWGNALFVPLGHLLDHPIFIIIVTITPSSSSSKVIFHIIPVLRMSSVFGSSKISLAHLLKFIAISIAIPFAVSTIEIEGEGGISGALGNRFTMSYSLSSLVIFWTTSPPHISPAWDL